MGRLSDHNHVISVSQMDVAPRDLDILNRSDGNKGNLVYFM